jgi:hypothetical protein
MTRVMLFSAALVAGLAFAASVSADPVRPVQDPAPAFQYPPAADRHADYVPDPFEVQAIHNFGACIVGTTPEGARRVLALDYRTSEYKKSLHSLAEGHDDSRCLLGGWRYKFAPTLLAGAMAEALLKSDMKDDELPQRLGHDSAREPIEARGPLEKMALCTVMQAPGAVLNLFKTEPASDRERAAMKPVDEALSDCLPKGTQVTLNGPAVRSLVALAAWRVANTPEKADGAAPAQPGAHR